MLNVWYPPSVCKCYFLNHDALQRFGAISEVGTGHLSKSDLRMRLPCVACMLTRFPRGGYRRAWGRLNSASLPKGKVESRGSASQSTPYLTPRPLFISLACRLLSFDVVSYTWENINVDDLPADLTSDVRLLMEKICNQRGRPANPDADITVGYRTAEPKTAFLNFLEYHSGSRRLVWRVCTLTQT